MKVKGQDRVYVMELHSTKTFSRNALSNELYIIYGHMWLQLYDINIVFGIIYTIKSDVFSRFSKRQSSVATAIPMIYSNVCTGWTIKFIAEFPWVHYVIEPLPLHVSRKLQQIKSLFFCVVSYLGDTCLPAESETLQQQINKYMSLILEDRFLSELHWCDIT